MSFTASHLSLDALRASLRPGQRELAEWQSGVLAVSAVPGAGKSYGMAVAAAIAIAENNLQRSQQLIVVTFTRSAAANIKVRIRDYLRQLGLPQGGFSVHTLHGLALNIARNSQLSGLNLEQSTLVTAFQSQRLLRTCVEQWVVEHPKLYQQLLEGRQFDGEETEQLRRQSVLRTEVLPSLASTTVREAKSSGLSPADLREIAGELHDDLPILAIAAGLYERYQTLLRDRNFIDYDDMILAALRVLEHPTARQIWQKQVFAVFEDEAQDSTPLQTQLLEILAASGDSERPNLVRVGDPNQAINSTFTPADPFFFREFCQQCLPQQRFFEMDQAGRSTQVILEAANFMLTWVNQSQLAGSEQPFREQAIHPVAAHDPQRDANPQPEGHGLEIYRPVDIFRSVELIGQRVAALLSEHPDAQAAVLVRENRQGRLIADLLSAPQDYGLNVDLAAAEVEIYDVGGRDRRSQVPSEILTLLQFLDRPHSPDYLKAVLSLLLSRQLIPSQDVNSLVAQPEEFLYPGPLAASASEPRQLARQFCTQLLRARVELPHYQLITFLALALQYDQAELATADKLVTQIAQQTAGSPTMSTTLPILQAIASSERFETIEVEEPESRYVRRRQLTIITMHKAKGLDWDYVFIPFLHEQTIPGQLRVPTPAQFLGEFSLAEVARAQIRASLHQRYSEQRQAPQRLRSVDLPSIPDAWSRAVNLKVTEEFRLLYVAMTRARKLLWLAAEQKAPFNWGSFDWKRGDRLDEKKPCPILKPLVEKFPDSFMGLG
jgi:DNA helicase II / ATP-dependent DNA helicase PcrA